MRIKKFVIENKDDTISSIKNLKEQPLESLAQLFPISMVCTSVVGFIVAIVIFIVEGGFSNQIISIKGDFFGFVGFTFGTTSILTSGVVSTIISVFILAEIVVLVISYFKTESKAKKIAVGICLGIGGVLFGFAGFFLEVGFGVISSEKAEMILMNMLSNLDGMQTDTIINGLKIISLIGVALLIVFIVLMLISQNRWIIKNSTIAILISYIILPLALLLIENVIPMFTGLISIVVIGGALLFVAKIFLGGGEEDSGSYDYESSNYSELSKPVKTKKQVEKNPDQNEITGWSEPFWRGKGGLGITQGQEDHIYCYNYWKQKQVVCGVSAFEKGEVAIIDYNTKRRIMGIGGCKTPLR
jgi:hypothetical protein